MLAFFKKNWLVLYVCLMLIFLIISAAVIVTAIWVYDRPLSAMGILLFMMVIPLRLVQLAVKAGERHVQIKDIKEIPVIFIIGIIVPLLLYSTFISIDRYWVVLEGGQATKIAAENYDIVFALPIFDDIRYLEKSTEYEVTAVGLASEKHKISISCCLQSRFKDSSSAAQWVAGSGKFGQANKRLKQLFKQEVSQKLESIINTSSICRLCSTEIESELQKILAGWESRFGIIAEVKELKIKTTF